MGQRSSATRTLTIGSALRDARDQLVRRPVRVQFTGHDPLRESAQAAVSVQVADACAQGRHRDRLDLAGGAGGTALREDAVLLHPRPVLLQRLHDLVDALGA